MTGAGISWWRIWDFVPMTSNAHLVNCKPGCGLRFIGTNGVPCPVNSRVNVPGLRVAERHVEAYRLPAIGVLDMGTNTVKGLNAMALLAIADEFRIVRIPVRVIGVLRVAPVTLRSNITSKSHVMGMEVVIDGV